MSFSIKTQNTLFHGTERIRKYGIAQLNQGESGGSNFTEASMNLIKWGFAGGAARDLTPYALLSIRFMDTLGGYDGEWYASEAFLKMYNAMCGSAYDTTDFSRADLAKHIMFGRAALEAVAMIDRRLDVYAINDYVNLGVSNVSKATFMLLDSADDYAACVAARNELVPYIKKLMLPTNIAAVDRSINLCRHVYCDDVHDKTQMFMFVPYYLYLVLREDTDIDYDSNWYPSSDGDVRLADFIQILIDHLKEYTDSAFFASFSKYLWRSMVDPNGPKIAKVYEIGEYSKVKPDLSFTFIYDSEVCGLIRNGDYIGIPINERNTHTTVDGGNLRLHEDDDGILRQGRVCYKSGYFHDGIGIAPIYIKMSSPATLTVDMYPDTIDAISLAQSANVVDAILPVFAGDRLLNLEDFPSNENAVYTAMSAKVQVAKYNTSWRNLYIVQGCGPILLLDLVPFSTDPANNDTQYENDVSEQRARIPFKINVTAAIINGSIEISEYGVSSRTFLGDTHKEMLAENMFCGLFSSPIFNEVVLDENDSSHCYLIPRVFDVDNLVTLPAKLLQTYFRYDSYDRFNMETNVDNAEVISTDGHNDKKPSNNKRRHSKGGKGKGKGQKANGKKPNDQTPPQGEETPTPKSGASK